jgi:hypothetical protein
LAAFVFVGLFSVVDDVNDLYVLMRVDKLGRGKTATISWKWIEAPEK